MEERLSLVICHPRCPLAFPVRHTTFALGAFAHTVYFVWSAPSSGLCCLILCLLKSPCRTGCLPDLQGWLVPSGLHHYNTLYLPFIAHLTHSQVPRKTSGLMRAGNFLILLLSGMSGLLKYHSVNERGECLQGARFSSYIEKTL